MKLFWILGSKSSPRKFFKKIKNKSKNCYKTNELIKLIEYTYSYAKLSLNKYSCHYLKQLYSQPALLTILVLKKVSFEFLIPFKNS